ncbi:MAG: dTDP-4-dehydrorhamnose 3,5-epimerase [bacterium]|nr:dTDP-4-dehydrorhamnose 3,5-epimerase [bacterium]
MRVERCALPEVMIVEPSVFTDARGVFFETYHAERFRDAGIADAFVQDNHSISMRGVLRGLHAQARHPQAKLVRCVAGTVFDVAVDARRGAATFGRWIGVELSAENRRQLYVPAGFLHGFCVLGASAEVVYKCSAVYAPGDEFGVVWNDPDLAIAWPIAEPTVSAKDAALPRLAQLADRLPAS